MVKKKDEFADLLPIKKPRKYIIFTTISLIVHYRIKLFFFLTKLTRNPQLIGIIAVGIGLGFDSILSRAPEELQDSLAGTSQTTLFIFVFVGLLCIIVGVTGILAVILQKILFATLVRNNN